MDQEREYAGGVFGDVDVDIPGPTDIASQFSVQQPLQPSVASALQAVSQVGTQQAQQIQAQQQFIPMPMQQPTKPSALKAAMPWLIGGLAIAGVAAAIVFFGKKKDGDSGGYEENPKPRKKAGGPPDIKRCPVGTEVQTLILDAGQFDKRDAVAWAREHDFKASKIHTTGQSHRIRQHLPTRYRAGSFKTITLTDGVKAVIGCPR